MLKNKALTFVKKPMLYNLARLEWIKIQNLIPLP